MIYIDSDTVFKWSGMRDSITLEYVNDADVEGSLQDLDGNEILAFLFSPVEGSNGDYEGSITAADTTGLDPDGEYIVQITATHNGQQTTVRGRHKVNFLGYK